MKAWIRRHWHWLLLALLVLVLGTVIGWRLAAMFALGLAGGKAGHSINDARRQLDEAQRAREAQGDEIRGVRDDLERRAEETDQIINEYYRQKGGPHDEAE